MNRPTDLSALALSGVKVASLPSGPDWIAAAGLASLSTGNLPVVVQAGVAVLAHHVGQAVAHPGHAVAVGPAVGGTVCRKRLKLGLFSICTCKVHYTRLRLH